ncbi:hypothetical protein PF006_g30980 [Phytophthora fragariae]|uniref:Uncharacterized protein n=1 Tax=Phytophthora fragariae TaxID=53985 RepID=A0A6A3PLY1_9STRA|nr:hypothetical protein PF006_g30980 [Phytophthora fragariae]
MQSAVVISVCSSGCIAPSTAHSGNHYWCLVFVCNLDHLQALLTLLSPQVVIQKSSTREIGRRFPCGFVVTDPFDFEFTH